MNTRYMAGIVAALVLGAVFIAGCTSPTMTSPTPSTGTSTSGTRDAFLDQFVISMERELRNNTTVSAWVSKWQNGSVVSIQTTFRNVTSNQDINLNRTVMRFASIDDATNYVNNNREGYVETTNVTKALSLPYKAYELTKGSAPQVYRAWTRILGADVIQQIDDVMIVDSANLAPSSSAAS